MGKKFVKRRVDNFQNLKTQETHQATAGLVEMSINFTSIKGVLLCSSGYQKATPGR